MPEIHSRRKYAFLVNVSNLPIDQFFRLLFNDLKWLTEQLGLHNKCLNERKFNRCPFVSTSGLEVRVTYILPQNLSRIIIAEVIV